MKNISSLCETFSSFEKCIRRSQVNKTKVEARNFAYASYLKRPIQENVILFCSNNGFSIEGDPRAIFEQLFHDETYIKSRLVWTVRNENVYRILPKEYLKSNRVQFVTMGSEKYLKYLAESQYVVTDTRFPAWFIRRKEQVYIQTRNRFENFRLDKGNYIDSIGKQIKDYMCSNIILSPSTYFTEEIFAKEFKLSTAFDGKIVEGISPRHQLMQSLMKEEAKKRCVAFGFSLQKKQILLVFGRKGLLEEKIRFCQGVRDLFSSSEFQICVKGDVSEFSEMKKSLEAKGILVLKNFSDMSLCLTAVDYLIGDGAGYTFDYLATGRMILFTDLYGICKGDILSEKELPGPVAHKPEDVVRLIKNQNEVEEQYRENYTKCREYFISDGSKQSIMKDSIIKTNNGKSLSSNKERLLFIAPLADLGKENCTCWHLDFYQILHQIDYEKYDVTVVSNRPSSYKGELNVQKDIDKRVRILYRTGLMVQTQKNYIDFKYLTYNLFYADDIVEAFSLVEQEDCKNEWKRICGNVSFDRAIYFGPPITYFLMLLHCLNVKEKVYVERRNQKKLFPMQIRVSKVERRFQNLYKIVQIFDKIVYPSKDAVEILKQFDVHKNFSNHVTQEEYFKKLLQKEKGEKEEIIRYQDSLYQIKDFYNYEDGQIKMTILKDIDKSAKNFFLEVPFCTSKEPSQAVAEFSRIKRELLQSNVESHRNVKFHIFDPYGQWNELIESVLQSTEVKEDVLLYFKVFMHGLEKNADGIIDFESI